MNNLEQILSNLKKHHRNKQIILTEAINYRLNQSLINYYKSIYESFIYLLDKSNKRIVKNLNEEDE